MVQIELSFNVQKWNILICAESWFPIRPTCEFEWKVKFEKRCSLPCTTHL